MSDNPFFDTEEPGGGSSVAAPRTRKRRQLLPRAQRFVTELPFRYRVAGTQEWHEGWTANISTSGVLFRAAQVLQLQTVIDMVVTLPAVMPGSASAELQCRGLIVRKATEKSIHPAPVLAASIMGYRVVRQRQGGSRSGS